FEGFFADQRAASADAEGAGLDPVADVVQIDSAGGGEAQLRQGGEDVLEIAGAERGGGEDLDHITAQRPGAQDFGGGESAGDHHFSVADGGGDDLGIGHGGDDELRSGRDGIARGG